MSHLCDYETCRRALDEYLTKEVLKPRPQPGPDLVCWEHQANREPIRLSFAIKVF